MTMAGEDEIAVLARETMGLGDRSLEAIERNIAHATQGGRWDDVQKWCRVRLRIHRMTQEQRRCDELYISDIRRGVHPGLRAV
jgi:hypothetical protein